MACVPGKAHSVDKPKAFLQKVSATDAQIRGWTISERVALAYLLPFHSYFKTTQQLHPDRTSPPSAFLSFVVPSACVTLRFLCMASSSLETPQAEKTPLIPVSSSPSAAFSGSPAISVFSAYGFVFFAAILQALRAFSFHVAEHFLGFPASTAVLISSVVYIIFCFGYIAIFNLWSSFNLPNDQVLRLGLRGFLAASTVYLNNIALKYIPVGNSMTILALAPAMTSVLAAQFLHDSLSFRDIAILLVNIGGVALVAQPSVADGGGEAFGVMMAVLAAVSSSVGFILVKKMGVQVHFILIPLSIGFNGLFLALLFMRGNDYALLWKNKEGSGVALIGAVLGCITQSLVNRGMQIVRPGLGLVVRTFNVPVTVILGALFLGEHVTWIPLLGILLVLSSIGVIGMTTYFKDRARRLSS